MRHTAADGSSKPIKSTGANTGANTGAIHGAIHGADRRNTKNYIQ
jgi:hypothetical protein